MSFPPDSERLNLSTIAVKFSLKNLFRAFSVSPLRGPYPKIGRNLGTVIEVSGKQPKIDKVQPDAANEYGTAVIVFKEGVKDINEDSEE